MIKTLILKFLSAFAKPSHGEEDLMNLGRWPLEARPEWTKLKGSQQERLEATKEWSKAENIAKRIKEFEEKSAEALELGKKLAQQIREQLGLPSEDPPIPDPLPDDLKGQHPSTIKAILRHRASDQSLNPGWREL